MFVTFADDISRDQGSICVVETPADVLAVESSAAYRGRYFVLLGRLSPLDGYGPSQLGLDDLEQQLGEGNVKEVIWQPARPLKEISPRNISPILQPDTA